MHGHRVRITRPTTTACECPVDASGGGPVAIERGHGGHRTLVCSTDGWGRAHFRLEQARFLPASSTRPSPRDLPGTISIAFALWATRFIVYERSPVVSACHSSQADACTCLTLGVARRVHGTNPAEIYTPVSWLGMMLMLERTHTDLGWDRKRESLGLDTDCP